MVLGPFRAAVEVRGLATGTRELGVLALEHLVPRVHAILLTGGSAFGLAAADGVMGWLAERGIGHETAVTPVPIVPAAVIYDLRSGRERPDSAMGRQACQAAGTGPVPRGRVGAGAGATVGKLGGIENAAPGGLGSAARREGEWTVGALVVVNAVGDVVDPSGRVVAGGRTERPRTGAPGSGENTTLAVVATDAPLDRTDLGRLARMAGTALARRIVPVHTPFDGDVIFAVSPTSAVEPVPSARLLELGVAARDALEEAILDAVAPHAGR